MNERGFKMERKQWGMTDKKEEIFLYTLKNEKGIQLTVSNLGAVLTNLFVPDKNGVLQDVVLGFDSLNGYLTNDNSYLGATVGRNANRIEEGTFELAGKVYQLAKNEAGGNLHGGAEGYQLRVWTEKSVDEVENAVTFSLNSPDGDQGFPGNLDLAVTYQLTNDGVTIQYHGKADQTTIFNPTNHSYFNLNGHQSGSVLNHQLTLASDVYTPLKESYAVPTGELASVANTAMDFRNGKTIGLEIDKKEPQLLLGNGYDHNFMLSKEQFATVIGDQSGIVMQASTNLPAVQLYTANFVNEAHGKQGVHYQARDGFCLETQFVPNAMNLPTFQQPVLEAGQAATYWTSYDFTVN